MESRTSPSSTGTRSFAPATMMSADSSMARSSSARTLAGISPTSRRLTLSSPCTIAFPASADVALRLHPCPDLVFFLLVQPVAGLAVLLFRVMRHDPPLAHRGHFPHR